MTHDGEICECGVPLAEHPPLAKPKPFVSRHAARNISDKHKSSEPVIRPGWRSRRPNEEK
ncbi:MAG TPA: hypothetical protein VFP66_02215 [Candidatus Limnocylindrales bacterium]|nr:hypothetical protein [Candidatus Limnocylindrales bacterium]